MAEKKPGEVENVSDLAFLVADLQKAAADYDSFAEDVLLSLVMPETPRFTLDGKYGDHIADKALGVLFEHLAGYRKILDFLRKNGIDVNAIIGDSDKKKS